MINLEITGFYFRLSVPADGIVTVLDLMNAASGVESANGGVMDFALDFDQRFIETISVNYGRTSTSERHRENLTVLPKRRPTGGLYSFTEDVTEPENRISRPGQVPGLHAWQYYVYDINGRMKSRVGTTELLGVKPAAESDQLSLGEPLEDGDTVAWRIVAIFGLNHYFDSKRNMLLAKSGGRTLGLKAAIEVLREAKVNLAEFTVQQ
jgi:hypothetical protein